MSQQVKEMLTVLPYHEVEDLLRKAGSFEPIKFFQAFMISAWYGVKN